MSTDPKDLKIAQLQQLASALAAYVSMMRSFLADVADGGGGCTTNYEAKARSLCDAEISQLEYLVRSAIDIADKVVVGREAGRGRIHEYSRACAAVKWRGYGAD